MLALLAGFMGVLIIIQPGTDDFNIWGLIPLTGAFIGALTIMLMKKITQQVRAREVIFYCSLIIIPVSFSGAYIHWQPVNTDILLYILLLGLLCNLQQLSGTSAVALSNVTSLMPYDFSRLVFISILAWIVYGEVVSIYSMIGGVIILFSAIYAIRRERKLAHIDPNSEEVV